MTDAELLNLVSIFSRLSPDEIDELLSLMIKRSFERDEMILAENDPGDSLYIITKGNVKITRFSETGNEVIFSILGEGDFFGMTSLLDNEKRFVNSIALGNVGVLILKRGDFLIMIQKFPQIVFDLVIDMARLIRQYYLQIERLSFYDAQYRVGSSLLYLAEELGTIKNGVVNIPNFPLNRDIAGLAGTCKETVSRAFRVFNQMGMIQRDGHNLSILDYKQFKRIFN